MAKNGHRGQILWWIIKLAAINKTFSKNLKKLLYSFRDKLTDETP